MNNKEFFYPGRVLIRHQNKSPKSITVVKLDPARKGKCALLYFIWTDYPNLGVQDMYILDSSGADFVDLDIYNSSLYQAFKEQ